MPTPRPAGAALALVLLAALLAGCAGTPPPAQDPGAPAQAQEPSAGGYVAPVLTYAASVGEVADADDFAPVNPFAYRNPWR